MNSEGFLGTFSKDYSQYIFETHFLVLNFIYYLFFLRKRKLAQNIFLITTNVNGIFKPLTLKEVDISTIELF